MADVFVSYKREDAARVRKLVTALRGQGLDVWWDEDIPGGAPWEATIEKQLAAAKAVIVCWSPDAVASENVRSEARRAQRDGRLVQVFLKACEPPLFFGERQGFDLTKWRGSADDARIAKVADCVRRVASGERIKGGEQPKVRHWLDRRMPVAATILFLLVGSFVGWWLLSPAKAGGPQTLAVLPFRALNPGDANLVDTIWDDTRGAIGRNPNLRVIGRNALESLADKHLDPAGYRRKIGADYLLNGSVEHVGQQVQMKLSLVRTKDAAELWSDTIGGKLDDVFAFQQRIANEVEGRIRGRVAPAGGVSAKNIATSGEVYSIFADARAYEHKRDPDSWRQAAALLKKAVALDPNYAPAWAELGVATDFVPAMYSTPQEQAAEPIRLVKRALQLAPNLAHAHAALGMVQGLPAQSEPDLRRAVALDPGDAEAWMWLGSLLGKQYRNKEALDAYTRAVQLEPLLPSANGNKISLLVRMRDETAVAAEFRRIANTGDPVLLGRMQWAAESARGNPGSALAALLRLRSAHPETASLVDIRAASLLQQLGFIDQAQALYHNTAAVAGDYKGVPEPASAIWGGWKDAKEFWLNSDAAALMGRLLPKHGRLAEYMMHYRRAFPSADGFIEGRSFVPETMVQVVPTVAVTIRAGGENAQAQELLGRTEPVLRGWLKNAPETPELLAELAYFRAAMGSGDEAVSLLARGVAGGWLPDNQYYANDIADEPCFAALVPRPDFQAVRRRILTRIEEERRKVPAQLLAQTYPGFRSKHAA